MVKKNRMLVLAVVASVLLALIIWTTWGNTALELNTYTISRDRNSILPFRFNNRPEVILIELKCTYANV